MPTLLTWTDRGAGPAPHHRPRDRSDRGPVLRLLDQPESATRYDRLLILTTPAALPGARQLAQQAEDRVGRAEIRLLALDDPSDHAALFEVLGPVVADLSGEIDVLLSAGTPQAQTLWVILVQAGLLDARMLQVIPPAFVPDPHPRAIREVRLDVEGFPEIVALRREVRRLRAEIHGVPGMVGGSASMAALTERLARVAPTRVPVLITGETGTGKELVAAAIHEQSDRSAQPFVVANCGAFSEGVLTSELFGHEAGSFTGATRRHRGLFEQAHGGTLFLDEVGELPLRVQISLLRVLQTGDIRRVGAEASHTVDVRLLAATHRDLRAEVDAGRFREDLYYRLRGAELSLPPLRHRGADLERLVAHFLAEAGSGLRIAPSAWEALRAWRWPGNVRELRAEVLRWTVFVDHEVRLQDLAPEIRGQPRSLPAPVDPGAPQPLAEIVAEAESAAIRAALRHTDHNLSATARLLQIDRNTLKRKLARHGLPRRPGGTPPR